MNLIEPYAPWPPAADELEALEGWLLLAAGAWNAAALDEAAREEVFDEVDADVKECSDLGDEEAELSRIVREIARRKRELYAHAPRTVSSVEWWSTRGTWLCTRPGSGRHGGNGRDGRGSQTAARLARRQRWRLATRPSRQEIVAQIRAEVASLLDFARSENKTTFYAFEKALLPKVLRLGRLLVTLFLCVRSDREDERLGPTMRKGGRLYKRRPAQPRNLSTCFGVVRYFRTYMRGPAGHGFHPLDVALGLTADRLSMHLLSLAARLATQMSFAQVVATLGWFLGAAPSTEVIERSILGLGRRTGEWFEKAPAPENDGEVLVIQIDGKGVPTATDEELERRRGKRRPNPYPDSPRHRGRERRLRYSSKPRRKKGDKSKNARMATLVVMYTLREAPDGSGRLLGPINRRVYASFAPKKHAFEFARREADKRGFTKDSGKLIQLVTDGDDDLATYAEEYFPDAKHTVDVMHVTEYIWAAGECLYREGSDELAQWIDVQKERLYGGREAEIVDELKWRLYQIPTRGPGNKGRRERLQTAIGYLEKRLPQMHYKELLDRDLELSSGAVEGAIKNVIAYRFDHGGSRWIRERAEALLQLRCIECNGDWDAFIQWFHDDIHLQARRQGARIRIQQGEPSPLPKLAEAA